ncbi:hypothetical protein BDR04DRAFT_1102675 [Suillus decipiens]|nr:hypothetical protein BDR04DRAFT_1102675 [Suillus decipiens]
MVPQHLPNLTIAPSAEDYVTFFAHSKHGKTEYKVTEKQTYGFKYIYPVSKPQKDAIDVDNAADFTNHELTKKLDKSLACHRTMYNIMGDNSIKGRIDHRVPRTKGLD